MQKRKSGLGSKAKKSKAKTSKTSKIVRTSRVVKPSKQTGSKSRKKAEERSDDWEKPKAKTELVVKGFSQIWETLFNTPVHLDSALSKQSPRLKSIFAQIIPAILLKPASLAEALGIGVPQNEPWGLKGKALRRWRPAELLAERLYEMLEQKIPPVHPMKEDFPPSMISEWESTWGTERMVQLVDTLAREAPLSIRASRRVGAQTLLNGLTEKKQLPVRAELSHITPFGIRLSGYVPILGSEWYEKGAFEIQDEGSQFMALFALWPERYSPLLKESPGRVQSLELLSPPPPKDVPAWTVVDACAGAGGKSIAIADALKGKGRIYAYDISEKKLQALRRRATRAGLNNIQAVALTEGAEEAALQRFKGSAQVVLVDAPCSGWGVLRRNPDIKWRQSEDVLTRMPEIQFRLLSLYSSLVAPGGRLVYGVCTFRSAETRDVIQRFLKANPEFVAQEGGYLGPGPCDGFFMQSLLRAGDVKK